MYKWQEDLIRKFYGDKAQLAIDWVNENMSGWGEFGKKKKRKWPHGVNRVIEEAIEAAEPAAEWLRTHPPGARLPDNLEPGYEPDEYEPESKGTDELWKA
jgi:hypothetical protein